MDGNTYFKLCGVVVILLLCRVLSATSDECSLRWPKWKDFGGNYCYMIEENATVSWIDAVYQCFSEGGSLASFRSADVAEHVINNVQNRTKRLYIGLWKRNDGTFEWVDKSAVDFTNWYPGEPNLYFERCTEVYAESGMWNDVLCSETFGYICSKPKINSNELTPTKACPETSEEWRDFGGDFCYILEEESKASHEDAAQRCFEAGGSLASFHSFQEISSVLQRIRSHKTGFHIGLQLNIQGKYKWFDGSPFDMNYFDIWHSDSESRKCVAMSPQNGQWFGLSCNYELGYICSVPKVETCVEHMIGDQGVISSPNYPRYYGRNEVCVWYITVRENSTVFLEFLDFQVENSLDCQNDFVTVLDGHEVTSPVLGKFCGYSIPKSIRSTKNKMTVILRSDARTVDVGFNAYYERGTCGGVIVSERGDIKTPHYPSPYRRNENCTWEIIAPENHTIALQFRTFEVESSYNCIYDSVVIRDGLRTDDPILGKFCGNIFPNTIQSSSNKLSVTFESDGSNEGKGFEAIFRMKDISKQVSVGSLLQELNSPFMRRKTQAIKDNLVYKTVKPTEEKTHPDRRIKSAVEVVLQRM